MRSISSTIARLAKLREAPRPDRVRTSGRLRELRDFGSNPGALGAHYYVPPTVRQGAPLVVVMHGCTQNAVDYDIGSGWSQLAEEQGFALLFPEQRRTNNFNLCFNWYEPAHIRRGAGEPLSIAQMIDTMATRHGIDRSRVFVNGLSAGGAMTSVMLATYPELFAGGAIIAGLPFGSAASVSQALDRMRGSGSPGDALLAAAIAKASPHSGPWPTVSIWHGTSDHVVGIANADAILKQWQAMHGVAANPDHSDIIDGVPHRVWQDANGRVVIEEYRVPGMGHGTPLATRGDTPCGQSRPHMLEVGISSTRRLATFWKLLDAEPRSRRAPPQADRGAEKLAEPAPSGVTKVIEDALRAAGLVR
ncbi:MULTISPECIES: extracellular catalytic domain type 1 short-chain-length polyhydroxyalkanoate depolymerase [unclassified Sphingomonas]|uniref:extracellular catalytic domain type 1 short-chain-length polyhydroxyalkanoate depolymerase n=1 Tax=unclassified Sphingomonas TaxID=196159 RepID=UPI00082D13C4|nr:MULTISPECIES: PHB depolymerase family esterase [unclassified Sphingomonas]